MNLQELARRIAVVSNGIITTSLFVVLIWWRASLILFVAGWILYGAAWLMDGDVPLGPMFTAPE